VEGVAQANRALKSTTGRTGRPPRSKPGVKRERILEVAIDEFGRYGYEETKWADIAAAVGIGPTALYHYFESKQHCLYEIMGLAVADFQSRFDRITAANEDWVDALVELLVDAFELTESEMHRNRILVAEQGLIGIHRTAPREEAARESARTRTRDLEFAWGTFLARGMQQGHLPESDPQLLARAVLGLYNSVWHWYRPGGPLALPDVGRFFVSRQLAVLGCDPDLAADRFSDAAAA
jgi:TetR/AcrR family transcriptional regulator, cholesterol catabolism regulator